MVSAAYMHTRQDYFRQDVLADFSVEQIFSANHSRIIRALHVNSREIAVERMPDDGTHRYLWLAFTLPGGGEEIRALAEFTRSCESSNRTHLRFKHLFPDFRARLEEYLVDNAEPAPA
jgi:hypothetical protein